MDVKEKIEEYYGTFNENERLSSRFGNVEFVTTVHYIEKYLKPGAKIIEIGAGTGRYSHYFARQGYEVDAVELVAGNIEIFKANTQYGEKIKVMQGNAVDLSSIESEKYDITLLLGPMYHLSNECDGRMALSEALRITKRCGIVFSAYILNEMTVMDNMFVNKNIETEETKEYIKQNGFHYGSFYKGIFTIRRIEEIDSLMKDLPVEMLHRVGTDMYSILIQPLLDSMSEETYRYYLDYILSICERCDMIGLSGHLLDIFRKN